MKPNNWNNCESAAAIGRSPKILIDNELCRLLGRDNVILISIHAKAAGRDDRWYDATGWCAYTTRGDTRADALATRTTPYRLHRRRPGSGGEFLHHPENPLSKRTCRDIILLAWQSASLVFRLGLRAVSE